MDEKKSIATDAKIMADTFFIEHRLIDSKTGQKKNATLLNGLEKVINKIVEIRFYSLKVFCLVWCLSIPHLSSRAQILFHEECFRGVVTAGGYTRTMGFGDGQFEIEYQQDFSLRRAIAFTYRYGMPEPATFLIDNFPVYWSVDNQVGMELDDDSNIQLFAVNAADLTNFPLNSSDIKIVSLPNTTTPNGVGVNDGWWSLYTIFLYESPQITDSVCLRIYTANQKQNQPQNYTIETPPYQSGSDVGFAIYSDRLSGFFLDRSRISINNQSIGEIWGVDATNPESLCGVRGHFYYKDGTLYGLDDDVPNTTIQGTDGIAVINDYLQAGPSQNIQLRRVQIDDPISPGGANPHPAFFITYKPACALHGGTMPGTHSLCRGDTIQLQALSGYEHYAWWPAAELSDSTVANPHCFATESRWYTVRMWNDDPLSVCAQTIPVYVTVHPIPEPANIAITPSTCPSNTGRVVFQNPAGIAPFTYWLDGVGQNSSTFNNLAPGTYPGRIVNGHGCEWEGTVTVPLTTQQQAAFRAFPQEGDSPLYVFFRNESTGATSYQWLIDGEPYAETFHFNYTFADTGTYSVSLVAYLNTPACADTATVTIRVNPGIRIVLPNVFTPNGDGRNDRLVAELFGVSSMRWEVYNRWGNLLHSGEDTGGAEHVEIWDGTAGGNTVPAGVYSVVLTAVGVNGKKEMVKGMVTVGR